MLYIQDPFFYASSTVHEALIQSCSTSITGFGAYAFASKSGIDILLKDQEFDSFLERGNYSLVIGIDEITNLASLQALNEIVEARPNLTVHAFNHNNKGSLFHPKLSFFRNEVGTGSLIVGSCNLTLGGLRRNREAFSVIDLSEDEYIRIETSWLSWLAESSTFLKNINDENVINKARENIYPRKVRITPIETEAVEEIIVETGDIIVQEEGWQFYDDSEVLVAEIPRSGNRWKQANFDILTFQNFFGATPGDNSQRVLLRNIEDDFTLSSIEIRPSVSVISQNYRFELDAASGLMYPVNGKPVGIFIKLTTRMFLYHLFMPNHPLYDEITNWLNVSWTGRNDRMKRIVTSASEINNIISQSVFSRYMIQV